MFSRILITAALAALSFNAGAGVSSEEAAKLGTTLTPIGAEKAGNAEGTIPEWTGGLTKIPADYEQGSGILPDPYAGEKPRLVITGENADEYKDKLTAVTYALLKRFPTMRVDVYPTHRPVVFPERLVANTAKNAVGAKTINEGNGLDNALPGIPFPIPQDGYEVIWNHLVRFQGVATNAKYDSFNVDAAGVLTLSTTGINWQQFPPYLPENNDKVMKGDDPYWYLKQEYLAPARRAGEILLVKDSINPLDQPRRAWQYLPGQRRVKLAPEVSYDTPNPGTAGTTTYDDGFIFNGAMDRYDFKLVGKKEMFVPYNAYKAVFFPGTREEMVQGHHFNPDLLRWELHRVWEVEATLKPGKRHIYHKRVFYVDEDAWVALASDEYDARGELFRGVLGAFAFAYQDKSVALNLQVAYDLVGGLFGVLGASGRYYGQKYVEPYSSREWNPDSMAGAGIR